MAIKGNLVACWNLVIHGHYNGFSAAQIDNGHLSRNNYVRDNVLGVIGQVRLIALSQTRHDSLAYAKLQAVLFSQKSYVELYH